MIPYGNRRPASALQSERLQQQMILPGRVGWCGGW